MLINAQGMAEPDTTKMLWDAQQAWNRARPDDMLVDGGGRSLLRPHLAAGVWGRDQLECEARLLVPVDAFLPANAKKMQNFALRSRADHVFGEAGRVYKFYHICREANPNTDVDEQLQKLGALMNESHRSCSTLYACSCPELDELAQLCRSSGAFGSRLTGAGWGGCVVSLVSPDKVAEFMQTLKAKYYAPRDALDNLDNLMFVTKAGRPAGYMKGDACCNGDE